MLRFLLLWLRLMPLNWCRHVVVKLCLSSCLLFDSVFLSCNSLVLKTHCCLCNSLLCLSDLRVLYFWITQAIFTHDLAEIIILGEKLWRIYAKTVHNLTGSRFLRYRSIWLCHFSRQLCHWRLSNHARVIHDLWSLKLWRQVCELLACHCLLDKTLLLATFISLRV